MLVPWKRDREKSGGEGGGCRGVGRGVHGGGVWREKTRTWEKEASLSPLPPPPTPQDLSVQTLIHAASSDKSYINRQPPA